FLAPSDQKLTEFYKAIVKMIAEDLQPVSIVENSGFRHLVKLLDSRYQIPSRRAISRTIIPNMYDEVKNKIQVVLNDAKYISVTTDIWTSINTDSFITITVHFFPKLDINLKTFVLCTKKLTKSHTAVYLSQILTTELNKFDILHKVVAIVTDGGRNINVAVRLMNIQHIPCTAHKLHLVVRNALSLTDDDLNVDTNNVNNDGGSSDSQLKEI
ncbi:zinc finger BED domain-containing protein 1-like, partial [Melanaphis sacchari]|uniref:zinc finger BED domain-containing protein 1-like n=1 Tax=Melanaphis sacchari TaxID=742174 RepID=UPI000DC1568F